MIFEASGKNIKQKLLPFSLTDVTLHVGLYLAVLITTETFMFRHCNFNSVMVILGRSENKQK